MSLATIPIDELSTMSPFLGTSTNTVIDEGPAPDPPAQREPKRSGAIGSGWILLEFPLVASPTLDRLGALLFEPEEDDYGRLRPTHEALSTARDLIRQTEAEYDILPAGSVSTDSEGGIRITWLGARHQVQVICPADSKDAHLYFEHGDDYDMEHEVTSAMLAKHLRLGDWV